MQGYEPQVLDYLLEDTYTEEDFDFDDIPLIKWNTSIYFPDMFIPKDKLIIEVKSEWTLKIDYEKNKAKALATIEAGYDYICIVWDDKKGARFLKACEF